MNPELITFKFCPFGQRIAITLREKGVAFETRIVDPDHMPDWFAALSPLGKVPLLRLDDKVFFETPAIAELIDDLHPPSLLPSDPMLRARCRGWIAFAQEVLHLQVGTFTTDSESSFLEKASKLERLLTILDSILNNKPYFSGDSFSLVDAAYAPMFLRLKTMQSAHPALERMLTDRLAEWSKALLARASVIASMPENFDKGYRAYLRHRGSWLMSHHG